MGGVLVHLIFSAANPYFLQQIHIFAAICILKTYLYLKKNQIF